MLMKFLLVMIVWSEDGMKYRDFVDEPFDDKPACEKQRATLLAGAQRHYDKTHFVFTQCVKARPLHSLEI